MYNSIYKWNSILFYFNKISKLKAGLQIILPAWAAGPHLHRTDLIFLTSIKIFDQGLMSKHGGAVRVLHGRIVSDSDNRDSLAG